MSTLFAILFSRVFGLFHYAKAGPFLFLGSPLWLNLAWLGSMMIYLRFLPIRKIWYIIPVYVLIFSVASTALDMVFHQAGLLIHTGWNSFYRFLVAIPWFYGAAWHQQLLDKVEV